MAESTRLYAGTQEGMVVIKSNGNGWEVVNHEFKDKVLESVSGCRSDPQRVYAGVAYDGLYRTASTSGSSPARGASSPLTIPARGGRGRRTASPVIISTTSFSCRRSGRT